MLGGVVLGKTPFRGALPRRNGDVTFVLKLAGFADKTVTARGDQPISERVKLARTPARSNVPERDQPVNPFAK